jgi:hypothetical protein
MRRNGKPVARQCRVPNDRKRFERDAPNDLWQIDGATVELDNWSEAWIVGWLEDHGRDAVGATPTRHFTVHAAWRAMETTIAERGAPRQLVSQDGLPLTSRKRQKPETSP